MRPTFFTISRGTGKGAGFTGKMRALITTALFLLFLTATGIRAEAATLTVCPSGCDSTTINGAIALANPAGGDTINVAAGTYAELVVVNKPVTINGANASVNPCTGTRGPESIVGTPTGAFPVTANNVTNNGFTIQGVEGTAPRNLGAGIHIPVVNGTQILNNIIQGNTIGIYPNGDSILIQNNSIRNNNVAGSASGNGIYSDAGLTNSTVNANCFTNTPTAGFIAVAPSAAQTNLAFTNNTSTNSAALYIDNTTGLTITGNTITGGAFSAVRLFDINDGSGISAVNTNVNVTNNALVGNDFGIRISALALGSLTASCNRIVNNTTANIQNNSAVTIDARNNWFGVNTGPNTAGGGIVTGPVTFNPWLVLSLNGPGTVFAGGMASFTGDLNTNSAGLAAPCASGGVPNTTPITFASTCGTMNPAATTTTGGAATSTLTAAPAPGSCNVSTTVDNQTVTKPITTIPVPAPVVTITDPLGCTGPGDVLIVTVTATNTSGSTQTGNFTATLNAGLFAVPGSGTASVGTVMVVNASTVTWAGSLAAGQSVTVTYRVQVADGVTPGATLCINTMLSFGGSPATSAPACVTVNCPVVGPGAQPAAAAALTDQKAGSVLIFPVYTSSLINPAQENTRLNLTNTDTSQTVFVHLFFVDGSNCSVSDNFICLTGSQTMTINANDTDPGVTGYVIAVAVDSQGCPIDFNRLIGDEYVKFQSGHAANLAAEAISALAGGLPFCTAASDTAVLAFDGVSYNMLPRVLAVDNLASALDGNSTLLIADRIGGDLRSSLSIIGTMAGIVFDQLENPFSFQFSGGCQFR